MGDVERITTAERHAEQVEEQSARAVAIFAEAHPDHACPYCLLAVIEDERVRVVEGLVATIKALPHGWVETGVDDGQGHREGFEATEWTRLLAVVEAAREDTT